MASVVRSAVSRSALTDLESVATEDTREVPVALAKGVGEERERSLLDDRPAFPRTGCTTVTVYPHESRRPRLSRRLLERAAF